LKKKAVLGITLTLLFMGILSLTFEIQQVEASETIYIKADGSISGTTDISTVDNVTYTFTDNIFNQSIIVEKDNIVLDGAGYTVQGTQAYDSRGIDLSGRSNVTIKNMTIKAFDYGIYLDSSSNNSISGNNITENDWYGIYLYPSSNYNSIVGNNITENINDGIYLWSSSGNNIVGNNMKNNWPGIRLYYSSSNSIAGNVFTNDGLVVQDSYGNVVEDNLVNGKPLVYLEGESGVTIENAGQVVLINCDNIGVENLNLSHTRVGIQLWNTNDTKITGNNITNNDDAGICLYSSSSNNSISGNNITNSYYGIDLRYSSNNNISENNITTNNLGIYLYSSSGNIISGNNITTNNQTGTHLDSSSGNIISGNNIANNDEGINIWYSSNNNSIAGNTITANSGDGISLSESSDNNSISGNNIGNNYFGIYSYGSSGNTILGNNIKNNSYGGIGLFGFSDNNSISGNNITDNVSGSYMGSGIELGSSNNNIISGNNIANNNYFGISLGSSSNNSIVGNNITTNKNYGIYLWDSSSNNSIYNNNLINNTIQAYTDGSVNAWDDGAGKGNYWSDYEDKYPDAIEIDGIWDTPYVIDENNQDNCPIVPEFLTWTSMLLILILLTVALAICKRRLFKNSIPTKMTE